MSQSTILEILNNFDKKQKEQVYDFILFIAEKKNKKISARQRNIIKNENTDVYEKLDRTITSMRQSVKNRGKQGMKLTQINKIITKARKGNM